MKHIMVVLGTRPEAIKLCPLILELKKRPSLRVTVCSTLQHGALLEDALDAFSVRPERCFPVLPEHRSCTELCAHVQAQTEKALLELHPDLLLVQGDTASAFGAALAAFHLHVPIGHVEAGLRTYRIEAPFPEEFYRQSISLMAKYHFAPTPRAKRNLLREGKAEASIYLTGNTVVDALHRSLALGRSATAWRAPAGMRTVLFTAHRREHLGEPMRGMFRALRRLTETYEDLYAICPLHPNPQVRAMAEEEWRGAERIHVIDPPGVIMFHQMLSQCALVLTDSGGIQEETVSLGIPTLVMRYSSERTEGLQAGVLRLAGSGEEGIYELASRLLSPENEEYAAMKKPSRAFGDGMASRRIADILEQVS